MKTEKNTNVLAFLSLNAIETHLKQYGYFKDSKDQENEVVSRMTKEIKSSTTWERRGTLKKKS